MSDGPVDRPRQPADSEASVRLALARVGVSPAGGLQQAFADVCRIAADALAVSRLSVWLLLDGGHAIRCEYLHQAGGSDVAAGAILMTSDYPKYFEAIDSKRVVAVSQVSGDALFDEFRESYLDPLGIGAMLDAPVFLDGRVVGIVCHEHLGSARVWTATECDLAASVSDAIARLIAEDGRASAEQTVRAYHDQLVRLEGLGTVGRLAAGVAHDVRNMTAGVMGAATLLLEAHPALPDVADLAGEIVRAAQRADGLVTKLLTLGRQHDRQPCVFEPRTFVRERERVLRAAAGTGATLLIPQGPPVGRVLADPAELERVLLNLVLNARDASANGGTITLSIFPTAQPRESGHEGRFVGVEVSDTGVGMSPETMDRIFEPFFTTKGDAGTGLGLAIVRQLVSLSGGFVDVHSVEGEGTAVTVYLPTIAGA